MPPQDPVKSLSAVHRRLLQVIGGQPVPLPTQAGGQGQYTQAAKAGPAKSYDETCKQNPLDTAACQTAAQELISTNPVVARLIANQLGCGIAAPQPAYTPPAQPAPQLTYTSQGDGEAVRDNGEGARDDDD